MRSPCKNHTCDSCIICDQIGICCLSLNGTHRAKILAWAARSRSEELTQEQTDQQPRPVQNDWRKQAVRSRDGRAVTSPRALNAATFDSALSDLVFPVRDTSRKEL